ncbi:hypothetical protein VNI00_016201 [Paramarasmius palmivorus]|uniref:Uncharacterized protein n=1 Tax=Paramarasmius palmivorus TaxID=297713 RepID=A0AAW0BGW5_9AGAR
MTPVRSILRSREPRSILNQIKAQALEEISNARISTGYLAHPITLYANDDSADQLQPTSYNTPNGYIWILTTTTTSGEQEETVFSVHGIIHQSELPPVTRTFGKHASAKHVQQKVVLTGLDSPTFSVAMEGLSNVERALRSHIRDDTNTPLPEIADHNTKILISNRYFTSKRLANDEEHIGFTNEIDPKGILERFRGDSLVHTNDNVVEYYERRTNKGEQSFKRIPPSRIKNGDIVEIQFTTTLAESFVGKGQESRQTFNTKLILRSITLLDTTFSRAIARDLEYKSKKPSLKRKIGHEEEETREAQDRLKRMAIDCTNHVI